MESILIHHGILGQKWGVRRFQNKDGSLTRAGRKRQLELNKSWIDDSKKALKIAEEDYSKAKINKEQAASNVRNQIQKMNNTKFSDKEEFEMLNQVERGEKVTNKKWQELESEYDRLVTLSKKADSDYITAYQNKEAVQSFIKGLSGQPLQNFDFEQGERGRVYVIKTLQRG